MAVDVESGRDLPVGLPPGPAEPAVVQALRYTWRFPQFTAEQHRRHGSSYTLRLPGLPDSVVTTDRSLVRHLLTGDPHTRRHANDILEPAFGSGSVMMLEPGPHLERRRLLLPVFHGDRIRTYAELVRGLVHEELDRWPTDGSVSVLDTARRITLAVIQSVVLGSRETSFARELARLVDTFASPLANFALFAPALARRSRWNVLAERFHRQRDRADALLADQVAAVRADRRVDAREDVLALLAQACDDNGRGLTDDELNDELKALLIAGHETTATAIGWAADLLAHRPQAAEHLRHADRAHLAASGKEILRLRTVAPIAASLTLLEPTPTSDRVLPAGAAVVVDAYTLHRDPELFSDPESFRPDRFLDRGEALPAYAYLPFGGGAHRCLGAALATLELETAVQAIVERFELEPVGPPERPRRRGPTLIPGNGATVRVRRRGG